MKRDSADPALGRPRQHVGRQGLRLADRRADARRLRRGLQALHPERPDRVDLRRQQHDVRDAVHDVRRLHARAGRPRPRRLPVRLDAAAHAGGARPRAVHRCSSFPASSRSLYAGWDYAGDSWRINEHSNVTADGPPVYQFKTIIPIAGALVLLQGFAEIIRCVDVPAHRRMARARSRTPRKSTSSSSSSPAARTSTRSRASARSQSVHEIDEAARQRGMGAAPA